MQDFWLYNGAVATQTSGYIHFSSPHAVQWTGMIFNTRKNHGFEN